MGRASTLNFYFGSVTSPKKSRTTGAWPTHRLPGTTKRQIHLAKKHIRLGVSCKLGARNAEGTSEPLPNAALEFLPPATATRSLPIGRSWFLFAVTLQNIQIAMINDLLIGGNSPQLSHLHSFPPQFLMKNWHPVSAGVLATAHRFSARLGFDKRRPVHLSRLRGRRFTPSLADLIWGGGL